MAVVAMTVARVVGVVEVVEAVVFGVELGSCPSPAAPVARATSAADSPASIAPAITPTAPRRLPVPLSPVATSRELAATWVAGIDALGCISHVPSSRFRRLSGGSKGH